ncbi:hypothetical protein GcM1_250180 [Golovinomyces cichoracearum]|uniref:Uncharacterized protein n=1 Tax=Golovinomyces cichoracearum TaxID=62708 RepID=A0A420IB39_9PEZI|nr:hypothetical protein GcM1_250180 [Golovinomyces cichoracearum]
MSESLEDSKNSELDLYISTKISEYKEFNSTDSDLWELFQENFAGFTVDNFKSLGTKKLQQLQNFLKCGGVRVPVNNRQKTLPKVLSEVLHEEIQPKWTSDDFQTSSTILEKGLITSPYLKLKYNESKITGKITNVSSVAIATPAPTESTLATTPHPVLPVNTAHSSKIQPKTVIQPTVATGSGRLITEVMRNYSDDQKCDGTNGSFDLKLIIFRSICDWVELPDQALARAFPVIFDEACQLIRNFFEEPGYQRRVLDEWNIIDLESTALANQGKTIFEVIQLLINKLRDLQYGLSPSLRTPELLHNKLIMACQGSPACKYAVFDPPADQGQLINKLKSSITNYEKEREKELNKTEAYFTDRRYYGKDNDKFYKSNKNSTNSERKSRGCWICRKPSCRSWKHPQSKQGTEKSKFRAKNFSKFQTNSRNFNQLFNEKFKQYVMEYEGDSEE